MGDRTKIEWTDATWNPIRGCSRVSEGCRNCYAEGVANRFKGEGQPYEGLIARTGQWNGEIKLVPEILTRPLQWQRPRRIFVNSMSDLFHENVPDEFIDKVFAVMAMAHWHTFQVLTKRPERMRSYFADLKRAFSRGFNVCAYFNADEANSARIGRTPHGLPNVWLGVSVENQETAEERIPFLLESPAVVRWISAEPLLGPIDLENLKIPFLYQRELENDHYPRVRIDALRGHVKGPDDMMDSRLNWIVVGGESGTNARPMHPGWVRSLRDQCTNAHVPFLFKQWGEWTPGENVHRRKGRVPTAFLFNDRWDFGSESLTATDIHRDDEPDLYRIGKKDAGRSLDGRTHDEYPEAKA